MVEAIVGQHLALHGGGPARSLAALGPGGPALAALEGVEDAVFRAGLARRGFSGNVERPKGRRTRARAATSGTGWGPMRPEEGRSSARTRGDRGRSCASTSDPYATRWTGWRRRRVAEPGRHDPRAGPSDARTAGRSCGCGRPGTGPSLRAGLRSVCAGPLACGPGRGETHRTFDRGGTVPVPGATEGSVW